MLVLTYDNKGEIKKQASGFFISKDGNIVTSRHLLQSASQAEIKTNKGKIYPIKKILADSKEDNIVLASVNIPQELAHPLTLSKSIPEVGEKVIVIGNPLGLEQRVSDGIVSAVREIPQFGKIIQITAPVSSGSSGSPVINIKGEVIGFATFQILEGQNLNFAIPYFQIGYCNAQLGRFSDAIKAYKQAIRIRPDDPDAHFNLGLTYLKLGDKSSALEEYKILKDLDTELANDLFNLIYE